MLHFAFGSNMDQAQMNERCPSARFFAIALFPGHRLAFSRRSTTRNCGVADAVVDPTAELWGVVYEISEADVTRLDSREGYRPERSWNSYWRRRCTVLKDGAPALPIEVEAYFAEAEHNPPKPNGHYKGLIVGGAKRWKLPPAYIARLEQIEVEG